MIFSLLSIIAVTLISTYKSLGFYFWHDDFAVFYGAKLGICILGWPYNSFCTIFSRLYQLLGYNPTSYFFLGIALLILASFCLYLLLKELFKQNVALILTLIFATGYIGSGIFFEAYDPFISYPSIAFLFLSLVFLIRFGKKPSMSQLLTSSTFFALSIVWFYARSSTYLVPILSIIVFYLNLPWKKKTMLSVYFTALFFFFFLIFPSMLGSGNAKGGSLINILLNVNWGRFIYYFLQTLGGFLLPSVKSLPEKYLLYIGLFEVFLVVLSLYYSRTKKTRVMRAVGLIWIFFLYLPYGIRSDWRLEPTHRYVMYTLPGFLLWWGTFSNHKIWKPMSLLVTIVFIVLTNQHFLIHFEFSQRQGYILKKMRDLRPSISENTLIYYDFPRSISTEMSDIFRVGTTPPESVIGAEYGINYEKIRLITDSHVFMKNVKDYDPEKLLSFYYDGQELYDTTQISRTLVSPEEKSINKNYSYKFYEDKENRLWSGDIENISIPVPDGTGVLPYTLRVTYEASPANFPLPFSKGCINCEGWEDSDILDTIRYFRVLNELRTDIAASASQEGEDTFSGALVDRNNNTIWMANRQQWVKGEHPVISLNFSGRKTISGIDLISNNHNRVPTAVEVMLDGEKKDSTITVNGDLASIRWKTQSTGELSVQILSTVGGDNPVISDISLFSSDNVQPGKSLGTIMNFPAAMIRTNETKMELINYLRSGVPACLTWEASKYGKGELPLNIVLDGKVHILEAPMPSTGLETPIVSLSCLNYPINITIHSVKLEQALNN